MELSVGQRIRLARQARGLTQAQLGERVGASESAVLNWEKDRYFPTRHEGAVEAVLKIRLREAAPDPKEQEIRDMDWLTPAEQDQWIALYRQRKASPPGAVREAS